MTSVSAPPSLSRSVPDLSRRSVALLAGGRSSERNVSLDTARCVADALRGEGNGRHRALLPRALRVVELETDGRWTVEGRSLTPGDALRALEDVDVFFSCLHGGEGEDGTIQGFLAANSKTFTGSGVRASALCIDKQATRTLAQSAGVAVAPGVCFSSREWRAENERWLARVRAFGKSGWVVKPRCGGSSVSTFVLERESELAPSIEDVLATGDDVLAEARVRGIELSCGVLGNRGEDLVALPPVEIRTAAGRFFDYQQKYSNDGAREICPPEGVSSASVERVRERALAVHRRAGCDGYSRIDFIVPLRAGVESEPVMLEVNTLPGLTARSLLPQEAAAVGMDYTWLCLWILDAALRRQGAPA